MEPGISLPYHHLVYHRRFYLPYITPQVPPGTAFEARSVWKQPLKMLLVRIQPDSPTRTLVVNGGCGLPWKFGKNSAPSGATQREVLRCRASDSLREGP